jgi:energy-coupling factor transport system ATP-binding protein
MHTKPVPVAVRAKGWGWRHAGRRAWAVRQLDLVIEPGERVLLLGASGSGKSTLLSALAGVLGGDDEGEAEGLLTVDGAAPSAQRGRSGLVMQDPDSQVVLARVGDDVAFGCENLAVPRDDIWPRVRESLGAVGLDLALDHPTSQLSGGQKQRLALAGVLAMRPGMLLLDEPTANLDPAGVVEVRDAVRDVLRATGSTLVVIEHRVATWLELVDRVVVLGPGGQVIADGVPATVFQDQAESLRNAGVWLPGRELHACGFASGRTTGEESHVLLEAADLGIGRARGRMLADEIELRVEMGTATALTGANGVGKSTLALTLGGLLAPIGGSLVAASRLADGAGPAPIRWSSTQLLTRIGSVFQSPEHQFLAPTVRRELELGPKALKQPASRISARVDELLARLRLDHLAEANPFTLSGGQKRRLSVATALATRPSLLIFDEPTFGQDATTWFELVTILGELISEGHAIVAATHDEEFVRALGAAELRMLPADDQLRGPTRTHPPIEATR